MNTTYFNNKIRNCIEEYLDFDKNNAIDNILKTVFESLLKSERETFLTNNKVSKDKANGFYYRMVKGIAEYFEIRVPRDRLGLFKPLLLQILKKNDEQMKDLAFTLYVKGLTTRDIRTVIKKIYNKKFSPATVSSVTKNFETVRKEWECRTIEPKYHFIYIDAIHINVKRTNVEKEAFYIILGVKSDFTREVLGVYNIPQESASGWESVFEDLKQRGLKECLLFVSDELSGLSESIKRHFPKSRVQNCIVHKKRNILNKVRSSDKAQIAKDLEEVFVLENDNFNYEAGIEKLTHFIQRWDKKYPTIKNSFKNENLQYYFAYSDFPSVIQRMLYTTNWIERLNKAIRRTEKIRNSFPSPDSAMNLIVAYIIEYEYNTYKYPITSMLRFKDILDSMYDT